MWGFRDTKAARQISTMQIEAAMRLSDIFQCAYPPVVSFSKRLTPGDEYPAQQGPALFTRGEIEEYAQAASHMSAGLEPFLQMVRGLNRSAQGFEDIRGLFAMNVRIFSAELGYFAAATQSTCARAIAEHEAAIREAKSGADLSECERFHKSAQQATELAARLSEVATEANQLSRLFDA